MSQSKPEAKRGRGRPHAEVKIGRKATRVQRIAIAIRNRREEAKLDVPKAASRAGISKEVWYRLERAAVKNLREGTIGRVAKVFRRTSDDLDDFGIALCAEKTGGESS